MRRLVAGFKRRLTHRLSEFPRIRNITDHKFLMEEYQLRALIQCALGESQRLIPVFLVNRRFKTRQ